MKQSVVIPIILLILLVPGCKSKTKEDTKKEAFFPALAFINSQVAHVDTSLYKITRLVKIDSTWDTTYIKREDFRALAQDFLTLPDIADKSYEGHYAESKFFDESLNRVIMTYTPTDKDQLVEREDVTIQPGDAAPDKVKNIIISKVENGKDSVTRTSRLLWAADESFQVTTIIQKPGEKDSTRTIKVTWE